jgi:hypothetical protein
MGNTEVMLGLVGGPLDGVCLPLSPNVDTSPTQLYVYYPDICCWSAYESDRGEGGAATIDVYRIKRGKAVYTKIPTEVVSFRLNFTRILSKAESQHVEKLGPNTPPDFK